MSSDMQIDQNQSFTIPRASLVIQSNRISLLQGALKRLNPYRQNTCFNCGILRVAVEGS